MDSEPFVLRSGAGQLQAQAWIPTGKLRAGIAIVHGQGEHIGRYASFAQFFNERGVAVMGMDHFGHGKSPGSRGHVPEYNHYLDGVGALLGEFDKRFPKLPVFLYGQSMGGSIAANFVLRRKSTVAGLVCSSAWFKLAFQPPVFKVKLASVMTRIYPAYSEPNGLNADDLSRDPVVCQAYRNDPLVHGRISAGAFFALFNSAQYALDHAADLSCPALIMHGQADKITSAEASREFALRAGALATYLEWPDARHELHNEPERLEVLHAAWAWIQGVCPDA